MNFNMIKLIIKFGLKYIYSIRKLLQYMDNKYIFATFTMIFYPPPLFYKGQDMYKKTKTFQVYIARRPYLIHSNTLRIWFCSWYRFKGRFIWCFIFIRLYITLFLNNKCKQLSFLDTNSVQYSVYYIHLFYTLYKHLTVLIHSDVSLSFTYYKHKLFHPKKSPLYMYLYYQSDLLHKM